jgi:molybdopterin converting factor small subunit
MKILFFGALSEIVGQAQIDISSLLGTSLETPLDSDTLQLELAKKYPALATAYYMMSVNYWIISDNTVLSPTDEIAFMPAFSGG